MLYLVPFALIMVAFVACDRDAPTKPIASAPAGKASDFESLFNLFGQSQPESSADTVEDSTTTDSTQTDSTQAEPEEIRPTTLELGGSVEGDRATLEALDRSANWREERPTGGCSNDACKKAPLRNWFSSRSLRKWECVKTNSEGRVVSLILPCRPGAGANSLWHGTLPPQIGELTHLEYLEIKGSIFGPLPAEIGQLRNLKELRLRLNLGYDRERRIVCEGMGPEEQKNSAYYCDPSYGLPAEIGNLENLEVLDLDGNALTGPLPPEIGNLSRLEVLDLNRNSFHSIPPEIGNLSQLKVLRLSGDAVQLPAQLGQLTNLEVLRLTGIEQIPPQIGRLSQLDTLWLHAVHSGSIPPEFGGMTNLVVMYISGIHEWYLEEGDPRLGGQIPPELGNLTNLELLSLQQGGWEGELPASFGRLTKLRHLGIHGGIHGGFISGTLPPEWGNMKALETLYLRDHEIEGTLPAEWALMESLQRLDLQNNLIEGPLPGIWGQMNNLQVLDLSRNFIDGPLPAGWCNMSQLRELNLEHNDLTASLPPEWKDLKDLVLLNLSSNQLVGPIPSDWQWMTGLRGLRLEYNQLSGRLPNLKNLENLVGIWLGGNDFEPDVPSQSCFSHTWYPDQLKERTGTYRGQPTYRIHVHGISLCSGDPPPESSSDYSLGG